MKKIILLTSTELRHEFFRKYMGISNYFQVIRSYCEYSEPGRIINSNESSQQRKIHLEAREQTEIDFFNLFTSTIEDKSNPITIRRGAINDPDIQHEITELNPDFIVSYGCSIIKEPLISRFPGRFINIHLGLSPYYRGSGTNYWPLVNNEPGFVGTTFMFIDAGIDTGQVIHQIRGRMFPLDTIHTIGNRLILDTAKTMEKIIRHSDKIHETELIELPTDVSKYYRNKDFTEESVLKLYENFENGIISKYLENSESFHLNYPIIQNPNFI